MRDSGTYPAVFWIWLDTSGLLGWWFAWVAISGTFPPIRRAARSIPHGASVHDLHLWAICPTLVCRSVHVEVDEISPQDSMAVVAQLPDRMAAESGILHPVFEVEVTAVRGDAGGG